LLHALSFGRFASTPTTADMARWYRQLARYAQSFALVGDWTVVFLGGDLKRKQRLAGRLADILADLYLLSAVLKRFEDEGRIKEDAALVNAIARDLLFTVEQSFAAVFANFPNLPLRWMMRALVFPLGRHRKPASDRETYRLARAVLRPGAFRDRLTIGTYVSADPKDVTGVLEDALVKVTRAEEVEAKFVRAIKKGIIERRLDRDAITDAVDAGVLTEAEAALLRLADQATDRVIKVDDFDSEELVPRQLSSGRSAAGRAAE
jgi:acyl-CoA dehydrogenase